MNIEAYIASGIIEEYVLGTVSAQEKQEVECMSHIYPEIKTELLQVEKAMEAYAMKHQIVPPSTLKETIFSKIDLEQEASSQTEGRVIPLDKGTNSTAASPEKTEVTTSPLWPKIAVAAAIALAMLSGWAAYELSQLREANSGMAERMERMGQDLEYRSSLAQLYQDTSFKVVRLSGLERSPESLASAFWNAKTNEVMLDVQSLPAVPDGKQYQLWSIVDGVPIDSGVLDSHFDGKILKMKPTKAGANAFAITLEKEGGSPTPSMEQMYVMGQV